MRLVVFGRTGQVAQAFARRAGPDLNIQAIGRDAADFTDPDSFARAAEALDADAIVNAVAYTAVDRAEDEPETANLVNAVSVGRLAVLPVDRIGEVQGSTEILEAESNTLYVVRSEREEEFLKILLMHL